MPDTCPECGAAVPAHGSCRDNFHALLLLESEIPDGPGLLPHLYAVACYALQHPVSMNYRADALSSLHVKLAESLDGRATLDKIRRRTGRATAGSARVIRRAGDPDVQWRRGSWPMTVADVLTVQADTEAYADRVTSWARSVREALDADWAQLPVAD